MSGAVNPLWAADGRSFSYLRGGERHRFDLDTLADTVVPDDAASITDAAAPGGDTAAGSVPVQPVPLPVPDYGRRPWPPAPVRGIARPETPGDLAGPESSHQRRRRRERAAVTTDGSDASRVKYGTASWVYGEELAQTTAIWWSPDSRKLAYYRFDESQVPDYYLR